MKALLLTILLFPFVCSAQKDTAKVGHPIKLELSGSGWSSAPFAPRTIRVLDRGLDGETKLIAEIDTSHHLKVYGDTLSVLKAILKSYSIEIKP